MEKDKRLEQLSDDVRRGIPVDVNEALEVINYQAKRQAEIAALPWYKRIFAT